MGRKRRGGENGARERSFLRDSVGEFLPGTHYRTKVVLLPNTDY